VAHEPIMKPKRPIHAEKRCMPGRSNTAPALPILWRSEIMVNVMKKITPRIKLRARNAGVAAVGEVSSEGALPDRTERSENG
jgi:hypothetical protein